MIEAALYGVLIGDLDAEVSVVRDRLAFLLTELVIHKVLRTGFLHQAAVGATARATALFSAGSSVRAVLLNLSRGSGEGGIALAAAHRVDANVTICTKFEIRADAKTDLGGGVDSIRSGAVLERKRAIALAAHRRGVLTSIRYQHPLLDTEQHATAGQRKKKSGYQ